MSFDYYPFLISFKLAALTTVILLFLGIPLSLLLVYGRFRGKLIVETLITLPMVLPPTVIGFYLLVLFSPNTAVGKILENLFGFSILFSFPGLVVVSCIHSLPYMVQPLKNGFSSVCVQLIEASYVLGKSRFTTLTRILLPNIRYFMLTGILMTFVHVAGEFGVVLMIGGSIPRETKVASIAIYEKVESMQYVSANHYAALLILLSVVVVCFLNITNRLTGIK